MRTTITLDDKLIERAREVSGITDVAPLLKAALQALVHVESSRQLARLAGSQPFLEDIPRRRPEFVEEVETLQEQVPA